LRLVVARGRLLTGLFESICYLPQLDDDELVRLLTAALLIIYDTHGLDIAAGGRYQGLYFLLAHESAAIRAHMIKGAKELGRFEVVLLLSRAGIAY
jgi:sugar phosphate isomerase/epimerase